MAKIRQTIKVQILGNTISVTDTVAQITLSFKKYSFKYTQKIKLLRDESEYTRHEIKESIKKIENHIKKYFEEVLSSPVPTPVLEKKKSASKTRQYNTPKKTQTETQNYVEVKFLSDTVFVTDLKYGITLYFKKQMFFSTYDIEYKQNMIDYSPLEISHCIRRLKDCVYNYFQDYLSEIDLMKFDVVNVKKNSRNIKTIKEKKAKIKQHNNSYDLDDSNIEVKINEDTISVKDSVSQIELSFQIFEYDSSQIITFGFDKTDYSKSYLEQRICKITNYISTHFREYKYDEDYHLNDNETIRAFEWGNTIIVTDLSTNISLFFQKNFYKSTHEIRFLFNKNEYSRKQLELSIFNIKKFISRHFKHYIEEETKNYRDRNADKALQFIKQLKFLREKQGVTQTALATKCGLEQERIAFLEQGKSGTTVQTFEKIINALGYRLIIRESQKQADN